MSSVRGHKPGDFGHFSTRTTVLERPYCHHPHAPMLIRRHDVFNGKLRGYIIEKVYREWGVDGMPPHTCRSGEYYSCQVGINKEFYAFPLELAGTEHVVPWFNTKAKAGAFIMGYSAARLFRVHYS